MTRPTGETLLAIGLMVGLFAYIIVRAVLIPITCDEAATFFHYIHVGKLWPGEGLWDANNHVLNSYLSWFCVQVFGMSDITIRVPNVLAGLLYLIFSFKLSFRIDDKLLRWTLFLSLVCSRLVLEFFAFTRGYGLSIGLMVMAIYFLYRWMQTDRVAFLLLAGIGIQLAALANLSLLLTDLLFFGWVIYWALLKRTEHPAATAAVQLLNAAAMWWLVNLSMEMKERGLLYYGSDEGVGFWSVTVRTLTENTFDPLGDKVMMLVPVVILATSVAIGLFIRIMFISRKLRFAETVFPYLLIGCLVGNFLLHHLMEVNYPADRVALHYMVLLPCALVFSLYAISKNRIGQSDNRWLLRTIALPLFLIPLGLAFTANFSHSALWNRDASARIFYDKLVSIRAQSKVEPTVVGYRMRSLPFNFYNVFNNGALSPIQAIGYRSDEADYQIAYLGVEADWSAYDTLLYDRPSDLYLMERKVKRRRKVIFSKQGPEREEGSVSFIQWYGADIDSLRGKDLLWDIEMEMPELKEPFIAWVSVTVVNVAGEQIILESIVLDWLRSSYNEGEVFRHHILIPNVPPDAKHMKVFFWNIDNVPIELGAVEIRLSEILEEGKE